MSALADTRDTKTAGTAQGPGSIEVGAKASSTLYAGAVAAGSAGYIAPLTASNALIALGIVEETKDNSAGSNGDKTVLVKPGVAHLANGDTITAADRFKIAYGGDDQTAYKGSSSNTRPVLGLILDVDSSGVWVWIHPLVSGLMAMLAGITGAAHLGVEDAAGYWAGATVEAVLAAIGLVLGGGTITKIQLITGTLSSGTSTVSSGIVVTAATKAFAIPNAVITGSTNFGSLAHILASNVVGAAGTGAVTIKALGADGALDVDAAGTYAALLIN